MYRLVYGAPHNFVTLAEGSLMEVIRRRYTSGDLILNPQGEVVKGLGWLFPWEKEDPECYARKAQERWWW